MRAYRTAGGRDRAIGAEGRASEITHTLWLLRARMRKRTRPMPTPQLKI